MIYVVTWVTNKTNTKTPFKYKHEPINCPTEYSHCRAAIKSDNKQKVDKYIRKYFKSSDKALDICIEEASFDISVRLTSYHNNFYISFDDFNNMVDLDYKKKTTIKDRLENI